MSAAPRVIRHAPSFAGGPLRIWNRVLWALALARDARNEDAADEPAAAGSVRLELDQALLTDDDLRLPVVNAHGDVVRLPAPEGGSFRSAADRARYAAALADSLAPTHETRDAIEALLPSSGAAPLDAAATTWRALFPRRRFPDLEIVPREGRPGTAGVHANRTSAAAEADQAPPTERPPEVVWIGPLHARALEELDLDVRTVLAGERAAHDQVSLSLDGPLGDAVDRLRDDLDEHLRALRPLAEEADPQLFGAWARLRRELRAAVGGFAERADRCLRNARGVRQARLRALTQGLRPLDRPQEDGLSLLAAAALFQLDWRRPERYLTRLRAGLGTDPVLMTTEFR